MVSAFQKLKAEETQPCKQTTSCRNISAMISEVRCLFLKSQFACY